MESTQLLVPITNAVLVGLALAAIALAVFLIRNEIRRLSEDIRNEISKSLPGLSERLSGDIKIFLESTEKNVRPIIKEGFETAGHTLAVTFSDTVSRVIVPLIETALTDASTHLRAAASRIKPVEAAESREAAASIQVYVDSGDYVGVISYIESMPDKGKRASNYHELANIYMGKRDRYGSISAAHKYKEIEGETPEGYRVLGYVYWWFSDFDTAITHTEHALRLAEDLSGGDAKYMVLGKIYNSLAYYYAAKGINKEKAFSYIDKCFDEPFARVERKAADIDTRGFVRLEFGDTEEEMDLAIKDFNQVLEMEPDNRLPAEHLLEAYKRKKELKNKRA